MTDTRACVCSFNLVMQFINSVVLLLVLVVQGSILDYYLILHNGGTAGWYFWFLADLLVLISFMAAVVIAYRFYKKKARMREAGVKAQSQVDGKSKSATPPPLFSHKPLPRIGSLPLGYLVWVFYATLLVVKIILLFKMEIAQKLDEHATFGPQLLKVVIGMSAVVFFLLVESHNDADPLDERLSYMHLLISSTAFEIFDSITFLSILLPNESKILLPFALENAILVLASANFFLPGLALFKLSRSEFGLRPRSLGLKLLYKALHLLLINIPFLVIRIFLWTSFGRDISLFLMKNIMAVVVLILTSIPDIRLWLQLRNEAKDKKDLQQLRGGNGGAGNVHKSKEGLELNVISGKERDQDQIEKLKMIITNNESYDDANNGSFSDSEKDKENSRL